MARYLLENPKEEPTLVEERISAVPVWNLEVPQQDNGFDCGVFMLHFIELWFLAGFMQKFISAPMSLDHRCSFSDNAIVRR